MCRHQEDDATKHSPARRDHRLMSEAYAAVSCSDDNFIYVRADALLCRFRFVIPGHLYELLARKFVHRTLFVFLDDSLSAGSFLDIFREFNMKLEFRVNQARIVVPDGARMYFARFRISVK